jgi:hypothetical protein
MFFHSLAVIGTPVDQTLALKINHARVFWVTVKAGANLEALGSERLGTARNEYGRVRTEGLGELWRIKNMAEQSVHLRLAINADVAGAIPVANGRNPRLIRALPDCRSMPLLKNCMIMINAKIH